MTDILKTLSEIASKEYSPEEYAEVVKKLAKALPTDFVSDQLKNKLAKESHDFSPQGYAAFYKLLYGFYPPLHVEKEVQMIFDAHEEGMGNVIFASRGFWKTVSISVTAQAWFIGLFPKTTNLTIGANDDSAEKITKAISAIIEFHPEWKRAFPNIVPDKGKWSIEGFSVLDTNVSREEWAAFQTATIDPTFVGGGYKSSRLNGKHPTGMLILDDIHDRENSASERERQAVIETVTKVILKTAMRVKDKLKTIVINIATPWATDDVNHVLKNTGEFKFINIPAATRAAEGQGVYCDGLGRDGVVYDDIVGWWNLTWPEGYGIGSFKADRATLGKAAFWQMIMLDLATASTGRLKYQIYPHDQINPDWVTLGGADTTTFTESNDASRASHFALAFVSKLPTGKAVVVDGVLEQCTQLEAENYIIAAQNRFLNWLGTFVENAPVGKVFFQTASRNWKIKNLQLSGLKGLTDAKVTSKRNRIIDMAKWFEDGTMSISDEDTKFLNALRRLFDKFYDLDPKHDPSFDAGDGVWQATKNMPDVLYTDDKNPYVKKVKKPYPLAGIGRSIGYGVR